MKSRKWQNTTEIFSISSTKKIALTQKGVVLLSACITNIEGTQNRTERPYPAYHVILRYAYEIQIIQEPNEYGSSVKVQIIKRTGCLNWSNRLIVKKRRFVKIPDMYDMYDINISI